MFCFCFSPILQGSGWFGGTNIPFMSYHLGWAIIFDIWNLPPLSNHCFLMMFFLPDTQTWWNTRRCDLHFPFSVETNSQNRWNQRHIPIVHSVQVVAPPGQKSNKWAVEKRAPNGCLGICWGWHPTQFCGIIINHELRIPIKDSV